MRIFLFLLFLLPLSLQAQNSEITVSGRVVNASGEPLPGASVVLSCPYEPTMKASGVCDENGAFKCKLIPFVYTLSVTHIGYEPYVSEVSAIENINLHDIKLLEKNDVHLNEVVVVARSIIYDARGYSASISSNSLLKKQSLDNVIRMLPGVVSNSHEMKLYTRPISAIYIDDRRVSLYGKDLQDYLKTFKGTNISSIQAIASSGVEEDASVSGNAVLKIYTVKPDNGGRLSVTTSGNKNAEFYRWNKASMNMQWRMNRLSAYALFSGTLKDKTKSGRTSDILFHDGGNSQYSSMVKTDDTNHINEVLGIGYDFNENNLLTIEQSGTFKKIEGNEVMHTLLKSHGQKTGGNRGLWNNDKDVQNLSFYTSYIHRLQDGFLELEGSYIQADEDYGQQQESLSEEGNRIMAGNRMEEQDYKLYKVSLSFDKSLCKVAQDKLKAGLAYTGWKRENNMDAYRELGGEMDKWGTYTDRYTYDEEVYAAYASYDRTFSRWSVSAGVRVEHLRLNPKSRINPENNASSSYTDWFPNVAVNYVVNQNKGHNLNLEYSRTIERPWMMMMNPAIRWNSEYNYSIGNPYLKPSYADRVSMRMNLFNYYIVGADYSHKDAVQNIYKKLPDSEVTYSMPENGGNNDQVQLFAGLNFMFSPKLMFNAVAAYVWSKYTYEGMSAYTRGLSVNGSFTAELPWGISVYGNVNFQPSTEDAYCRNGYMLVGMGNVSKSFLKNKLEATLTFSGLSKPYARIKSETYTQKVDTQIRDYNIGLSLRYTIQWGSKRAKFRNKSISNLNDMMRMEK